MFLSPGLNDAVVDNIDAVLPWSFISGFLWFLLHGLYKKGFQVVLRRIFARETKIDRLISIYWNACFSAATLPLAMRVLSMDLEDALEPYSFFSENAPTWLQDIPLTLSTKLTFILLTGYYLNHVSQISLRKGFANFDFVLSEVITIFFVLTFTTRCVLFGIGVICLINLVQCPLEVSRLLYCLSVTSNSRALRRLSEATLLLHCCLWYIVFTTIFPQYFLTTLSAGFHRVDKNDFSRFTSLILVNITLWAYVFLQFIDSVLSRFLFEWSRGGACPSLECLLFKMKATPPPPQSEPQPAPRQQARKNLKVVYQTLHCYMALKRNLRNIRQKRDNEHKKEEESEAEN